jgi:hypothetical protein
MPADDSIRVAADNKRVNTETSCGLQQGGIYRSPPCMVEQAGVPSCATSAPTRHDRGESGPEWECSERGDSDCADGTIEPDLGMLHVSQLHVHPGAYSRDGRSRAR